MKRIKTLFIAIMALLATTTISCDKDEPNDPSQNPSKDKNDLSKSIVGKWYYDDGSQEQYFCFGADGTGYFEAKKYKGSFKNSITRRWIQRWEIRNNKLVYKYADSSYESDCDIKIENKIFYFKYNTSSETPYSRINNNEKYDLKYGATPYGAYIKFFATYYYPLSTVTQSCKHGIGQNANRKFLTFEGPNVEYRVLYMTPYYEGIDAVWSDGTYTLNPSYAGPADYWVYYGNGYLDGSYQYVDDGNAKLKISHSGNIYTYTITSPGLEVYFVGQVK